MKAYNFYNQVANHYDQPVNKIFYEKIADKLLQMLPENLEIDNILEIGAGTGFTTSCIRMRFPDAKICALEPSLEMIARGCNNVSDAIWQPKTLTDFMEDTPFQLVVSSMAAHWFTPYEWQKLLGLNKSAVLALALPALNRIEEQNNLNASLKKLLFKIKPESYWSKQSRQFEPLLSILKRSANKVEARKIEFREQYNNTSEAIENLYCRGVLLALFGEDALLAKELLLQKIDDITDLTFHWSFKLIISHPLVNTRLSDNSLHSLDLKH